jgi:hypothetical protein
VLLVTQRVASVIAADKDVTLDALSGVGPPPAESSQSSAHSGISIPEIFFGIFLLFFVFGLIFGHSNYGRNFSDGPGLSQLRSYENCPDFLRQAGRNPFGDTKEATRPGSPPFLSVCAKVDRTFCVKV